MRKRKMLLVLMLSFGVNLQTGAMPADQVRGKLLYTTHCISCHEVEIHWREKKLARDWNGLKIQVNYWQKTAGLGWSEEDIEQVSAYLNAAYYHFPALDKVGWASKER